MTLSPVPELVTGTVRDATGKPRANVVVSLIPPADGGRTEALYRVANSDSGGRFTIANVPPGDYKAFAWQAVPGGSFYSAKFLERYEDKGQPIRVEASVKRRTHADTREPISWNQRRSGSGYSNPEFRKMSTSGNDSFNLQRAHRDLTTDTTPWLSRHT